MIRVTVELVGRASEAGERTVALELQALETEALAGGGAVPVLLQVRSEYVATRARGLRATPIAGNPRLRCATPRRSAAEPRILPGIILLSHRPLHTRRLTVLHSITIEAL